MSKRDKVKTGIQQRVGGADDVMYGEATTFDDDFFANIDDTPSALYAENEELKTRLAELETQGNTLVTGVRFQIGDFVLTPTGLVAPANANQEQMLGIADIIFRLQGSLQWLIGDWLVSADGTTWGETEEIAAKFGRKAKTLHNYKNVAKGVHYSLRRELLSYNHHAVLAHLPHQVQAKYLDRAEWGDPVKGKPNERIPWSVAQLRRTLIEDGYIEEMVRSSKTFDQYTASSLTRHLFDIARHGAHKLSPKKKRERLGDIDILRRLLDEAERRLLEAPEQEQ
jgi:hypothetical protein